MEHKLIPVTQHSDWELALEGVAYPYTHRWEYCVALSLSSGLDAFLYTAEEKGLRVICPLNIREKEDGYPELVSPYGMGGIVTTSPDGKLDGFRDSWMRYALESGFSTSYIMQHPLFPLCKEDWGEDICAHSSHYLIDLTWDREELWNKMNKVHRYELRKLEKDPQVHLVTDEEKLEKALLELYPQTVERVGASQVYNFSAATLKELLAVPDSLLFGVEDVSGVQAVALFLHTPWVADYFLNASSIDGRKYTRLLIWTAIETLKRRNVATLNLGGGVKPGDSLEQFKRRFGGRMIRGQVLKQVFDSVKYDYLCASYSLVGQEDTAYFPPYWKAG